jgi:hypothetical protein
VATQPSPRRGFTSSKTARYFELLVNNDSGNSNFTLCDSVDGTFLGFSQDGSVSANDGGFHTVGGAGTFDAYATGTLIRVTVDLTNQLVWVMTNGTRWNASGTANPATGVGGISYTLPINPLFIGYFAGNTGNGVTLKTTAADFASSPPSGFTAWENGAPSVTAQAGGWDPTAEDGTTAYFRNGGKTVLRGPNDSKIQSVDFVAASTGGKRYAEIHIDAHEFGDLSVHNAADTHYIHLASDGTIFRSDGTVLMPNGTLPFVAGDTVCIAFDAATNNVWYRVNAGNWNGSGTANPATGVGGFAIPFTGGGEDAYLKVALQTFNGGSRTLNTGTSAFAQTTPSGFSAWLLSALGATSSATLGTLTSSSAAAAVPRASAAVTLGALTASASAKVPGNASAAVTLGALTSSSAVAGVDSAAAGRTLGALTSSATAAAPINTSAAIALGALTSSAAVGDVASATVAVTLGALTASAAASNPASASAAISLSSLTSVATGHTAPSEIISAVTLDGLGISATVTSRMVAAASIQLGAMTTAATAVGGALISISAAIQLAALTSSSAIADPDMASLVGTLAALTVSAAVAVPNNATVSVTFAALTSIAADTGVDSAQAGVTLANLTTNATAATGAHASASIALGALTSSAQASAPATAQASIALAPMTVQATLNGVPVQTSGSIILGQLMASAVAVAPNGAHMSTTLAPLQVTARALSTHGRRREPAALMI